MIVTKTVYLIATPAQDYNFKTGEYEHVINYMPYPYSTYDSTEAVASVEVSFEVPDGLDPIQLRLQGLQNEKIRLSGEFQARLTEIERQINECLAIEG